MNAVPTLYERIRRLLLQHDREHAISGSAIAAELKAGGADVHRALGCLATKGEINRSGPPYKYWGNPGFRPTIKGQVMRDVLNGNANAASRSPADMNAVPTLYERIRRLLLQHDREHAISGTAIAAELKAGGADVHRALGCLATKGEINRSGPPYKYWGNPGFRPTIKG